MSQSVSVQKWKIVAGAAVAVILGLAGGGATERFILRHPHDGDGLTAERIRSIFRDEVEPIKIRLSALETRASLTEAELATYRSQFLPRVQEMSAKLAIISEDIAFIKGKWERQ